MNHCVSLLETVKFEQEDEDELKTQSKILILKDQLQLLTAKKPKYTMNTKLMAFSVYFQSRPAYNIIREYISLPHPDYFDSSSTSLHVKENHSYFENTPHII